MKFNGYSIKLTCLYIASTLLSVGVFHLLMTIPY